MCPTLEQILSRSLMRGKIPLSVRGSSSSSAATTIKEMNPSSIPSLKVPQAKPAPVHRGAPISTGDEASATSSTKKSPNSSSSSQHQDSVVAAFSGLSTPHFTPDPREKISERPERSGGRLRSLQDLPSLMESACVLDEWQSALSALDAAIDLVVVVSDDDQQHKSSTKNSLLFPIRKLIPLSHFVAAARVCKSNGAPNAFEQMMNEKMNQQLNSNDQKEEGDPKEESKNTIKKESSSCSSSLLEKMNYSEELSDITTEALVESGSWELALQRYENLCKEGKETVGSLNCCISACSARRHLWETALTLANPAILAREAELGEKLLVDFDSDKKQENESSSGEDGSKPLSHFGSSTTSGNSASNGKNTTKSKISANAITYASLVSTLENCGRPVEASKILESAPASDREAVMASYVALLKVWSDNHGKKSMRRF